MRPAAPRISRLVLGPFNTAAPTLSVNGNTTDLAITPDGSRIVYSGNNGTQLFVRALDAIEPVAIVKGAPLDPFISPDGQWVGFLDGVTALKKVAIAGGPPVMLATVDGSSRGASWAADNTIIFATANVSTGLQQVPDGGGTPTVLTRPDRARGESDHLWPEILPDGRNVLFTITALTGGSGPSQVAILDRRTGTRKTLIRGGSHAHYVKSGYLVYEATGTGTLQAIAFDPIRLETRGAAVPVVPDVLTTSSGGVDAAIADDGTLAYAGGTAANVRQLVWVDRQDHEAAVSAPPRAYIYPRLSPDGTRLALWAGDQESDIWLWDLSRLTFTRVTFDPAPDLYPVWTPDSRRLIFSSDRAGTRNLFWQAANGTGTVERLTEGPNLQHAVATTSDGSQLIFTETAPQTGEDVVQVSVDATHRVVALVRTPFSERNGIVSPDGRWLAYEANDSGQFDVYVRPYPGVNDGRWQVSTTGGSRPLWGPKGQELFYVSPGGAIMSLGVQRASTWTATTPTEIVKASYFTTSGAYLGRTYDVSPDGRRFLMIKNGGSDQAGASSASLIVVQNWGEELKRLVPIK